MPSSTHDSRYVDLLGDVLADHVRNDPDVMERASDELDRMPQHDNVLAWRKLLAAGPIAVIAVLTSRDPDVRGLKADNPFARMGLVDEPTRLAILDEARGR